MSYKSALLALRASLPSETPGDFAYALASFQMLISKSATLW